MRPALGAIALGLIAIGGCNSTSDDLPPWRLVFDGQSLNNLPEPPESFPSLVMAALRTPGRSVAVSTLSWTNLALTADRRLFPQAALAERTILVMQGGQADLAGEHDSGRELYDQEVAYAEAARSAGFDIIVGTTIPPARLLFSGTAHTERVIANELLLADPLGAFDAVVDLAGDPRLADPKGPAFAADGVHFSATGARVAADLIGPVVRSLMARG
ncbi:MAG: hypothetical protein ACT4OV_12895 [Microthrixaceae bacterium]